MFPELSSIMAAKIVEAQERNKKSRKTTK